MKTETKRWFYLAYGTIINIIIGQVYAWSVFANPLAQHFNWSMADVSVAFAICLGTSGVPILIAGKLQDYMQPKYIILIGSIMLGVGITGIGYITSLPQLYFLYGIMTGFSMGFCYSGVVPNMVRFFPERRGLVSGVLAAGVGSGALIWAPVAAIMIKNYGVLSTFKILGVLSFTLLFCLSLLVQTAPADFSPEGWKPSGEMQKMLEVPNKNWREMLTDPLFYTLAAIYIFGAISGLMIIGHASPILQSVGKYTAIAAGSWVGILAVFNSAGRVGWGFVSDKIGRMPCMVIIYTVLGLAMLWLALTPFAVILPVLIVGSCYGGFMGMIASVTADAFGPRYLPVNFGVIFSAFGIGAFIGPRLAGVIKAGTGDYSRAFLIASILAFLGIGFAILSKRLLQRRKVAASPADASSLDLSQQTSR